MKKHSGWQDAKPEAKGPLLRLRLWILLRDYVGDIVQDMSWLGHLIRVCDLLIGLADASEPRLWPSPEFGGRIKT